MHKRNVKAFIALPTKGDHNWMSKYHLKSESPFVRGAFFYYRAIPSIVGYYSAGCLFAFLTK